MIIIRKRKRAEKELYMSDGAGDFGDALALKRLHMPKRLYRCCFQYRILNQKLKPPKTIKDFGFRR